GSVSRGFWIIRHRRAVAAAGRLVEQPLGRGHSVAGPRIDSPLASPRRVATVDAREASGCGLALRSGTRIIIEDVNTDPDFEPHRAIAASTGFRGVQSTPFIDRISGKPLGMLSTRFRQPYRPLARELLLTDLLARQAADVIAFRIAEQRARDSEARLSAIVAQFPGAFGLFDTEGRLLLRGGSLSSLWGEVIPSRDPELTRRWRALDASRLSML